MDLQAGDELKIGVLITSRMRCSRFPGKALAELYGHPMIYWMISKAWKLALPPVVCMTDDPEDDELADYCRLIDVAHGRGRNYAIQLQNAAREIEATHVVQCSGDSPMVDARVMGRIITAMRAHPDRMRYDAKPYPAGYTGIGCTGITNVVHDHNAAHADDPEMTALLDAGYPATAFVGKAEALDFPSHQFNVSTAGLFDMSTSGYSLCVDYPVQLDYLNRLCEHVGHFPDTAEIEQAHREMRL